MSITSRLSKIINATGNVFTASWGITNDLYNLQAPGHDFNETLDALRTDGSKLLSAIGGNEGVINASVGAVPEFMRDSVTEPLKAGNKYAIQPTFRFLDRVYNDVVSRPVAYYSIQTQMAADDVIKQHPELTTSSGPLQRVLNTANLVGRSHIRSIGRNFDSTSRQEAWGQADNYSPGQALMMPIAGGIQGKYAPIGRTDERELANIAGSQTFNIMSGTVDAASRMFLDPTNFLGKAAKLRKTNQIFKEAKTVFNGADKAEDALDTIDDLDDLRKITKAADVTKGLDDVEVVSNDIVRDPSLNFIDKLRSKYTVAPRVRQDDAWINKALGSTKWQKSNEWMEGKNAPEIQQRFFANNRFGGSISHLLAHAENAEERTSLMRIFLGDHGEYVNLANKNAALKNQLSRSLDEQHDIQNKLSQLNPLAKPLPKNQRSIDEITDEIDKIYGPELDHLEHLKSLWATADELPTTTLGSKLRVAGSRSVFYQKHPLAVPIRTVFTKKPYDFIDFNDQKGFVTVKRMLEKSNLDQASKDDLLDRYMGAINDGARSGVYMEAEEKTIRSIFEREGFSKKAQDKLIAAAEATKSESHKLVEKRAYDGAGRSRIRYVADDGTETIVDRPMLASQNAKVMFLPKLDEIEELAVRARREAQGLTGKGKTPKAQAVDKLAAKAVNKIAKGFDVGEEILDAYMQLWRPATLFRTGWTVKVLTDNQLRVIAQTGALSQLKNLAAVGLGSAKGAKAAIPKSLRSAEKLQKELEIDEAITAKKRLKVLMDEYKQKWSPWEKDWEYGSHTGLPGALASEFDKTNYYKDQISVSQMMHKILGRDVDNVMDDLLKPDADDIKLPSGHMTNDQRHVAGIDQDHPVAWTWTVNRQIGQDPLMRLIAQGFSDDQILRWMRGGRIMTKEVDLTPGAKVVVRGLNKNAKVRGVTKGGVVEVTFGNNKNNYERFRKADLMHPDAEEITGGRDYLRRWIPERKLKDGTFSESRIRQTIADNRATVEEALPTQELRDAALKGKAKYSDYEKVVPDPRERYTINGPVIKQLQGKSKYVQFFHKTIDTGYKFFGGWTDDVLTRQPYFNHNYQQEFKRLLDGFDGEGITVTDDMIKEFAKLSREKALDKSEALIMNLREQSDFAGYMKFISPFFNALEDAMTRWTGIAIQHPDYIARLRLLWNSPEKAGLIRDENGAVIRDGKAYDPITDKELPIKPGKNRYITFMMPEAVRESAIFGGALKYNSQIAINKKALSMIGSASPGFGPIVQLAANEVVKDNPSLEDSLKWALPYGAQDATDLLTPGNLRKWAESQELDSDAQVKLAGRIYNDMMFEWMRDGQEGPPPKMEDAIPQAREMMRVKWLSGLFAPVSSQYQSPYQMYWDSYRQTVNTYGEAIKADPNATPLGKHIDGSAVTPEEYWYETYGKDYFNFTQRLTKSNDGVPATLEAYKTREELKDLVEKYPEYGRFIVGDEGAGAYSASVYYLQNNSPISETDRRRQRDVLDYEELETSPAERMAWIEYNKTMDLIDAEMLMRGFTSLQDKRAGYLRDFKALTVAKLSESSPTWKQKYETRDAGAMERKVEVFREFSKDPRINGREEMKGVTEYLKFRDLMTLELSQRLAAGKSGDITATSNKDLYQLWQQVPTMITQKNISFGPTYRRYFEFDDPKISKQDLLTGGK